MSVQVIRFPRKERLRIVVLISGGGTTLRNLIEKRRTGEAPIDILLVIASTSKAGGLRFAEEAGIPAVVVPFKEYPSEEAFSEAIFEHCRRVNPEFVVMGGFLKRLVIPPDFEYRVLNIHPALIPAFCGKGFYGRKVHEAVLEFGAKVSGCTVHFADNEYDHGPIILQKAVPVLDDDTPETLAARVFQVECQAYPEALRLLAAGRIQVEGRRVRILPEE
jgi:formyltetrahydrofolate-dependent phosphoribosylglycinamide formyltransferase